MKSDRFYLACLRDTVGTNISFHCQDGCGYSTNIDWAHVYTREEAQSAWDRGREFDLPLCADKVDALTEVHVDIQKLPTESQISSETCKYVTFQKDRWNGNDVYWLSDGRSPTCDFNLATVYSKPPRGGDLVTIPFELANQHKRRTIDVRLINKRSMVQAAGLITPDKIKRSRRRSSNPKTRWNCPGCGKISWQLNHCYFEGCRDVCCDEWR